MPASEGAAGDKGGNVCQQPFGTARLMSSELQEQRGEEEQSATETAKMLFRGGTEPGKREGGILERQGSVVVIESCPVQAPLSKDDSGEVNGALQRRSSYRSRPQTSRLCIYYCH